MQKFIKFHIKIPGLIEKWRDAANEETTDPLEMFIAESILGVAEVVEERGT